MIIKRVVPLIRVAIFGFVGAILAVMASGSELFAAGAVQMQMQKKMAMKQAAAGGAGGASQLDPALVDAVTRVQEAIKLAQQASLLIKDSPSPENFRTAADLFTQAGKRFEYAEGVFSSVDESVVSDDDLNSCESAKNQCYESAEKCRSAMQQ